MTVRLHYGDCLDLLPAAGEGCDLVYLDPPWPGTVETFGVTDHPGLLRAVCARLPATAERLILHLGCDTDPRFAAAIPTRWPFLRVCWLRFARPSYKGRLLNGAEVAYVFGAWPPSKSGGRVLPGETATEGEFVDIAREHDRASHTPPGAHRAERWRHGHPCPRRIAHVSWLLRWFCRRAVLDPFAGSGTTLLAASHLGLDAAGIEKNESYVQIAQQRLDNDAPLLKGATQ